MLVRSYNVTYGLNTTISISSNNYGKGQNIEKFIPTVVNSIKNNKNIHVYGDGKNIRDWIYVKDNCKCIYSLIKKSNYGQSYLIGSNNEISNIKMVKKIIKIFKSISNISVLNQGYKFVTDRKGHDFRYAIENKKLLNLIKINFSNFDKKLKNTIEFYLKNHVFYKKKLNEKWLKKKIENF